MDLCPLCFVGYGFCSQKNHSNQFCIDSSQTQRNGFKSYKRYGHLLSLVTIGFDEGLMSVLFQFFNPKHHCFTFPDYQLVPTLEEFSKILSLLILEASGNSKFNDW